MNRRVSVLGAAMIVTFALGMAAKASAPAGRYSINGGTVYDTKTLLTWQQTASTTTYTWTNAKNLCASVGSVLGGANWRLPTIKELQTLVDYANSATLIDPTYFGSTSPLGGFWSSTQVVGASSPSAWVVEFERNSGHVASLPQSVTFYVRCVR